MVYWPLCLARATALVGGRQLVGAGPPRDGKMLLERAWGVADIERDGRLHAASLPGALGLANTGRSCQSQPRTLTSGDEPCRKAQAAATAAPRDEQSEPPTGAQTY